MEESNIKILTIKTYFERDFVYIDVSDTGTGMEDRVKDRVFEPFFTTKEVGKGTGLGLSISYNLVQEYGGDIDFETRLNEGTTFTIKFPICK